MDEMNFYMELKNRFEYHAPTEEKIIIHKELREEFSVLAEIVLGVCPESRERSLAFTKLEEALFWANAAVARNP